jgi:hypothetical protein
MPADLSARLREALTDETVTQAFMGVMVQSVRHKWVAGMREAILAALAPVVEDAERERQRWQSFYEQLQRAIEAGLGESYSEVEQECFEDGYYSYVGIVGMAIKKLKAGHDEQVAALTAERDRLREALDRAGLQ